METPEYKVGDYKVGDIISFETSNNKTIERPIEVIIRWTDNTTIYYGTTATFSGAGGMSKPQELESMGYKILDRTISNDVNCNWVCSDQLSPKEGSLAAVISEIRKEVNGLHK